VERVFTAQPEFDPASSTREFSLLVSDYGVDVLGDTLAAVLAEEAPQARLRFSANTPSAVDRADQILLSTDLLVLPHGFVTDLSHRDLYRDEWVCIVATADEVVGEQVTVEDLETLPWVVTFHGPTAATAAVRQMRMSGIEPHVQVVTENFLTVPGLVAGSDRIALLQRRLVELLPLNAGIRALPPPWSSVSSSRRCGGTRRSTTTPSTLTCATSSSAPPNRPSERPAVPASIPLMATFREG
jgi:DNA-binding transcriptional LysR family regulator